MEKKKKTGLRAYSVVKGVFFYSFSLNNCFFLAHARGIYLFLQQNAVIPPSLTVWVHLRKMKAMVEIWENMEIIALKVKL